LENLNRPVASLSDAEALTLSEAKMTWSQSERLGELQSKRKRSD